MEGGRIYANKAVNSGGRIFGSTFGSDVKIKDAVIGGESGQGNVASIAGGGIYNDPEGLCILDGAVLRNNGERTQGFKGGTGILNDGTLKASGRTVLQDPKNNANGIFHETEKNAVILTKALAQDSVNMLDTLPYVNKDTWTVVGRGTDSYAATAADRDRFCHWNDE